MNGMDRDGWMGRQKNMAVWIDEKGREMAGEQVGG